LICGSGERTKERGRGRGKERDFRMETSGKGSRRIRAI